MGGGIPVEDWRSGPVRGMLSMIVSYPKISLVNDFEIWQYFQLHYVWGLCESSRSWLVKRMLGFISGDIRQKAAKHLVTKLWSKLFIESVENEMPTNWVICTPNHPTLNTYWTRPSPTSSVSRQGNIGGSEAEPNIILYGCNQLDVGRGQVQ